MKKPQSMVFRYSIMAILVCIMCFLFPYSGDDWAWGSNIGLERLETWFDNYSGRYVGNLLVLALTRSRLLRAVVMSITYTGTVYCVERLTKWRGAFTVTLLGLLLVPRLILRQAVVWTSGFSNYATSIFLTLVFFIYLNEHKPKDQYKTSLFIVSILFVLGICNTLIVEHLTIFNVVMSVCVFVYSIIVCRRIKADYLIYMISCTLGMVYMFSNSVFHSIAANTDGYRQIAGDGLITRAIQNYFGVIYHEGYFNNHFVNIMIFATCVLLLCEFKKRQPRRETLLAARICIIVMTIFQFYSLYYFFRHGYDYEEYSITLRIVLDGCLTFANLIATIALSLITTYKSKINKRIMYLWISFVVILSPLFAVTPIGSRCFYSTYIILLIIICELMKCISPEEPARKMTRFLKLTGMVLIALFTAYHFKAFFEIYQVDQQRLNHIMNEIALGKKSVELSHLPHEGRLWIATPIRDNDLWEERYKLFYKIPDDIDLVIVDYKDKEE